MLKNIYLLKYPKVGGAESQLLNLAKGLRQKFEISGHFVFINSRGSTEFLGEIRKEDFDYSLFEFKRNLPGICLGVYRLWKLINRQKASGIVSFLETPSIFGSLLFKVSARLKFHVWGIRSSKIGLQLNYLTKIAIKSSDIFVSNSNEGKAQFGERFGHLTEKSIEVIYNGVALPPLQNRIAKDKEIHVGMVANFKSGKDYKTLINIFPELLKWNPNVQLHCIGRDTEKILIEFPIVSNFKKNLHLHSYMENVPEFLSRQLDIGILLTDYEGQPNVILEYMAAGLPIVATNLPVIKNTVSENNLPFLVQPYDPEATLNVIRQIIEQPDLRDQLGNSNRLKVEREYSIDKMVRAYYDLIEPRLETEIS